MKKSISAILCLVLVLGCISTAALAAKKEAVAAQQSYQTVEKANEKIDKKVAKAVTKADGENDAALAEKLVSQTDKVAEQAEKKVVRNGGEVECEYEEVVVGDVTVLVDPLRVIWFPR